MRFSTRKLVFLSFLIALSIILTRIFSIRIAIGGVEGIRIGFGGLPVIFAGILFGPLAGGIVGGISDILGYVINPMGAYMPHFTLSSFLTGYIPGFLCYYIFRQKINFSTLLLSIATGQFITSVLLVPFFTKILFGIPIEITIIPRLVSQLINVPVYAVLVKSLLHYDIIRAQANSSLQIFK